MTQKIRHSGIYERLVSSDHDFLGQVAYSIYKQRKRDFIMRKQAELGTDHIPDEVIDEFIKDQTGYTLELYMSQADSLSREFLNASYEDEIAKEKQRLNQEYIDKYEELAKHVNTSWWYGVSQSLAASFLFIFIGYLILKFNGIWDILLQNLFRL